MLGFLNIHPNSRWGGESNYSIACQEKLSKVRKHTQLKCVFSEFFRVYDEFLSISYDLKFSAWSNAYDTGMLFVPIVFYLFSTKWSDL